MRLKNHTDIPSDLLRKIIAAARPGGISNFDVRVSNKVGKLHRATGHRFGHRGCVGRAYGYGSGYHDTANPFVVIRIALTDEWARITSKGGNGYLPFTFGSRLEAVLFVLAHELRHLWQANHTRGKVWGSKGRFSERDADAYALQMLRRYRRGELAI